jgi:hypothetical protein
MAAPAAARPALTHQIDVTFTNHGCHLQVNSVSRRNTTILFHLINNGSTPAGFVISSLTSKLAASHVGASDLMVTFQGPGHYPYRCTGGSGGRAVARGIFTIRKK